MRSMFLSVLALIAGCGGEPLRAPIDCGVPLESGAPPESSAPLELPDMADGRACDRSNPQHPCLPGCSCNEITGMCSPIPQRPEAECNRAMPRDAGAHGRRRQFSPARRLHKQSRERSWYTMNETTTFSLFELQVAARCAAEHDLMFKSKVQMPGASGDRRFSRLVREGLRGYYKALLGDLAVEGQPATPIGWAHRAILASPAAASEQYRAIAAIRAYHALYSARPLRPLRVAAPTSIVLDVEGVGRVSVETKIDMIARDHEERLWGFAFRGTSDPLVASPFWPRMVIEGAYADVVLGAQTLGYSLDRVAVVAIGRPSHSPLSANKKRVANETFDEFAARVEGEMLESSSDYFAIDEVETALVDTSKRLVDLGEMAANASNRSYIALAPWRNAESCRRMGGCQYLNYCAGVVPIEALVPRRFDDEA